MEDERIKSELRYSTPFRNTKATNSRVGRFCLFYPILP